MGFEISVDRFHLEKDAGGRYEEQQTPKSIMCNHLNDITIHPEKGAKGRYKNRKKLHKIWLLIIVHDIRPEEKTSGRCEEQQQEL